MVLVCSTYSNTICYTIPLRTPTWIWINLLCVVLSRTSVIPLLSLLLTLLVVLLLVLTQFTLAVLHLPLKQQLLPLLSSVLVVHCTPIFKAVISSEIFPLLLLVLHTLLSQLLQFQQLNKFLLMFSL